jgi:RNA polymerase sigma-70 factor (ECF subfamily)
MRSRRDQPLAANSAPEGERHAGAAQVASEIWLVERAADGDVAAFEELVRRHSERLYSVLLRFTADPEQAEEALQEAFLRAWRGIARFERRSSFSTWMYRIAMNEAKRQAERRPAAGVPADERTVGHIPDSRPRPEERTEQRELRSAIEHAVRELAPEYRLPLVLRDIEGLTTREAAELMELSEPAFKSRLHRARMTVRLAIEPLLDELERERS